MNTHGQQIATDRQEQLRIARVKACLKRIAELSRELLQISPRKLKQQTRIRTKLKFQLLLLKKNDIE